MQILVWLYKKCCKQAAWGVWYILFKREAVGTQEQQ